MRTSCHLFLCVFNPTDDTETAWYKKITAAYGVPLDTRHTYTKSDWEIWTSGFVTDTGMRDTLISSVLKYTSNGQNNAPLGDLYDTGTGVAAGFRARPVVGGHLALLDVSSSAGDNGGSSGSSNRNDSSSAKLRAGWLNMLLTALLIIVGLLR